MSHPWHDVSLEPGVLKEFNVIVEIPKDSK